MTPTPYPYQRSIFEAELSLEDHLKAEGLSPRLFEGITDIADRKARARIGIVMRRLGERRLPCGKTYGEAFTAAYGEPL